jgi:hypothetical protein
MENMLGWGDAQKATAPKKSTKLPRRSEKEKVAEQITKWRVKSQLKKRHSTRW